MRWSQRLHVTNDTRPRLVVGYRAIRKDGLAAINNGISNYTPLYQCFLRILSKVCPPTAAIKAVKLPSILCDCLRAQLIFRLVGVIVLVAWRLILSRYRKEGSREIGGRWTL